MFASARPETTVKLSSAAADGARSSSSANCHRFKLRDKVVLFLTTAKFDKPSLNTKTN